MQVTQKKFSLNLKDGTVTSVVSDRVFDNRTKVMKLYRNASPEARNKVKELLGIN